jgi:thiol-disulfide isomerase/thioredoxin
VRAVLCAVSLLAIAGCGPAPQEATRAPADDLGWISAETLLGPRYPEFASVYEAAVIAPEFIELITQVEEGAEFLVFLGTWCGDSEREVPRFLRIVQDAGIGDDRVQLYNLDRSKTSPDGLTARWGIERVPTFIILRDGHEVGRIVERPRSTLEGDLLSVLAVSAGS